MRRGWKEAVVRSHAGEPLRLRTGREVRITLDGRAVETRSAEPGVLELETRSGGVYRVLPANVGAGPR